MHFNKGKFKMKKKVNILLLFITPLLFTISCNNKNKQTLVAEVVIEDVPTRYDVDSTTPVKGIKYKGKREIDPANPPIIIDLTKKNSEKNSYTMTIMTRRST